MDEFGIKGEPIKDDPRCFENIDAHTIPWKPRNPVLRHIALPGGNSPAKNDKRYNMSGRLQRAISYAACYPSQRSKPAEGSGRAAPAARTHFGPQVCDEGRSGCVAPQRIPVRAGGADPLWAPGLRRGEKWVRCAATHPGPRRRRGPTP